MRVALLQSIFFGSMFSTSASWLCDYWIKTEELMIDYFVSICWSRKHAKIKQYRYLIFMFDCYLSSTRGPWTIL